MQSTMHAVLRWSGIALVALCSHAFARPLAPPGSFHAVYGVVKGPLRLGECDLQFHNAHGEYRFRSKAHPAGLATLLSSRQIIQGARGRWGPGGPRPASYERQVNEGEGWTRDLVLMGHGHPARAGKASEQIHRLAAADGVLDPASLLLQLMDDVRNQRTRTSYRVVDETGAVHRYLVQDRGTSSVYVDGRTVTARVLRRVREDGTDALVVYLAPALGGLPVRMDYVEAGITWRLSLEKLERG